MALVDDALVYRDLGWVTTPLVNDDQGYPKKPFVDGWQREGLGDVPGLPWGQAVGLGVVLGSASGNLAVIDVDDVELAERVASVFSGHYYVRTARGRGHLYVREADGASPSRAIKVQYQGRTVGIELKATGTQVAAPPSPGYEIWNQGPVLRHASVQKAFVDLCTLCGVEPPASTSPAGYPSPWQDWVVDGERNKALYVEACRLAEARLPEAEAIELLRIRFQVSYQQTPEDARASDDALVRTVKSGYQRIARESHQKAVGAPTYEPDSDTPPVVWLSQIKRETVRWLWRPYIPLGKLTLLEGDPGVGKSWVSLALATAISLGAGPPGMELTEPGRVLILTAEDGLGDTVGPRVDAMGGDSTKIAVFQPDVPVTLADLDLWVGVIKPLLVIVDPLVAFLGPDVDMFRSNETRPILARTTAMAERHEAAILLIRHMTKSPSGRAIYRGQGTIDFTAAARSVLLAGADPEDAQICALVHIKSNLAAKGEPLGYRLEQDRFSWTGGSDLTAARILGGTEGSEAPSKLSQAIDFLRQELVDGPVPVEKLKTDAALLEISMSTLRRARDQLDLQVKAIRAEGKPGVQRWEWALPA